MMDASQPSKNVKVFSDTREVNMEMKYLNVKIAISKVTGKIILPDTYLIHTLNQEKENTDKIIIDKTLIHCLTLMSRLKSELFLFHEQLNREGAWELVKFNF